MSDRTCILYFARTPFQEAQYKHLFRHKRQNHRALRMMHQRTQATLRKSGLPYVMLDEKQQIGETFGERISRGIQDLFVQGFERVIVVGNDCPQLSSKDLQQAHEALCEGKQVYGRNGRGGTYLIGVNRSQFCETHFAALPWTCSSLCDRLVGYFKTQGQVFSLGIKRDVNERQSLWQLLQQGLSLGFLAQLKAFFAATPLFPSLPLSFTPAFPKGATTFRGPPMA